MPTVHEEAVEIISGRLRLFTGVFAPAEAERLVALLESAGLLVEDAYRPSKLLVGGNTSKVETSPGGISFIRLALPHGNPKHVPSFDCVECMDGEHDE